MPIRALTLADLPALGSLKEPWSLSLDRRLTQPVSPRAAGWASLLPNRISGACTLVHAEEHIRAYVQTQARPGRDRAAVLHLGLAAQADAAWLPALLDQACRRAAERGASRLFAAVVEPEGAELFRQAGFVPYADETIYRMLNEETREEEISRPASPFGIRPQRPRDVWGIHSLYSTVTPRPAQLVENLTSDNWEAPSAGWRGWLNSRCEQHLVLEVDASICGYLHLARGRKGHSLEMMIQPQHRDLAVHLLQAGLCASAGYPPLPIYCALRGYHSELGSILESAGFQAIDQQTLLARQMTVRVRQRLRIFQPVLERSLEPARSVRQA